MIIVGVDPGTYQIGVAATDGQRVETLSVTARGSDSLERYRQLQAGLSLVFDRIAAKHPQVIVAVEDGIFQFRTRGRAKAKPAIMLAEARGLVIGEAVRRGWAVRRVAVQSWKCKLTAAERDMDKDGAYVRHFNASRGWACVTPDEVDAALIAKVAG